MVNMLNHLLISVFTNCANQTYFIVAKGNRFSQQSFRHWLRACVFVIN